MAQMFHGYYAQITKGQYPHGFKCNYCHIADPEWSPLSRGGAVPVIKYICIYIYHVYIAHYIYNTQNTYTIHNIYIYMMYTYKIIQEPHIPTYGYFWGSDVIRVPKSSAIPLYWFTGILHSWTAISTKLCQYNPRTSHQPTRVQQTFPDQNMLVYPDYQQTSTNKSLATTAHMFRSHRLVGG